MSDNSGSDVSLATTDSYSESSERNNSPREYMWDHRRTYLVEVIEPGSIIVVDAVRLNSMFQGNEVWEIDLRAPGSDYPRTQITLSDAGRLGPVGHVPPANHPQRIQALGVMLYGRVRSFEERCTYCASGSNNPAFEDCTTLGEIGNGACGNCLWNQNARGCSHSKYEFPDISYILIALRCYIRSAGSRSRFWLSQSLSFPLACPRGWTCRYSFPP